MISNYFQDVRKILYSQLISTYETPEVYQGKAKRIGFSGAHRTGKTSTALEVAKKLGIEYVDAKVSASNIWHSFKPSDNMTFGERIEVQEILLCEMEKNLSRFSSKPSFVTDRSPIDVLAYLQANIDNTCSHIFDTRCQTFINRCIELSREYFTHFVVIPPSIPFSGEVNKSGKVYNSKTYQESLTNIIIGAYYRYFPQLQASGEKTLIVVPDEICNLNSRIEFITSCIL